MKPSQAQTIEEDRAADAMDATATPALRTYARPDHDGTEWATLSDISAATGGTVSALSLRKRVHRLKDSDAVIWRPNKPEMDALAAQGAFAKSAQQGILVARDFVVTLCPEIDAKSTPGQGAGAACGKRARISEMATGEDDKDEGDDENHAPASKRPTTSNLTLPDVPRFEPRLDFDDAEDADFNIAADEGWSFLTASAAPTAESRDGSTSSTVSNVEESEFAQPAARGPALLAHLAAMAGGADDDDDAQVHAPAPAHPAAPGAPTPGLVRRHGKAVDVPADATAEQKWKLKVVSAYARHKVAREKAHQWGKVAAQFVLGATSVKRSGSINTTCRNADLIASGLFVEQVVDSNAVTGCKRTVAPAASSVWVATATELGVAAAEQ